MKTYYLDIVEGDNRNGGTSFDVLASGSDGATNGANGFSSASATFTPAMVGHYICFELSSGYWVYDEIVGHVDAHNVLLTNRGWDEWGITSGRPFRVGGRWRMFADDGTGASPWDLYQPVDYWLSHTRHRASPPPYSIGSGTWTERNPVVTLTSAICAPVTNFGTVWSVVNGATSTLVNTYKVTQQSGQVKFPTTTPPINTKFAYRTLPAPLDLSSWRRLSFWLKRIGSTGASWGTIRLCLCSDTLGDVIVSEVTIPQPFSYDVWFPLVLDPGATLPASVQSIAIYSGATAPSASLTFVIENLVAVKPAGDPLEFSLQSLIGKEHNQYWSPNQVYSGNAKRKPTPPNRNGFRYRVTQAGTSGANEPTWPMELGQIVSDGTVQWICDGPEDTWFPLLNVQSANSVMIEHNVVPSTSDLGALNDFFVESETCDTWLRTPWDVGGVTSTRLGYYLEQYAVSNSPTEPAIVSGGWDYNDMSVMNGESWFSAQRGSTQTTGWFFSTLDDAVAIADNINIVRSQYAVKAQPANLKNMHLNGNYYAMGIGAGMGFTARGLQFNGNYAAMYHYETSSTTYAISTMTGDIDQLVCDSNANNGVVPGRFGRNWWVRYTKYPFFANLWPRLGESTVTGLVLKKALASAFPYPATFEKLETPSLFTNYCFINPTVDAAIPSWGSGYSHGKGVTFVNFNGVPGTRVNFGHGAKLESETGANRHTPSGVAWKYTGNTNQYVGRLNAYVHPFRVALSGNTPATISIWVRRDNNADAPPFAELCFVGGVVPGVPLDIATVASGALGVYEKLTISVTPSANCVGLVELRLAAGYLDSVYFDDFEVA